MLESATAGGTGVAPLGAIILEARSESKALNVVTDQLYQVHLEPPVDAISPTSIRNVEEALPASPPTTALDESDSELDCDLALENPELRAPSPSTEALQKRIKLLEQRAFASEQERQRLLVGVWRGVTGETVATSDEDVVDAVWKLARQRDTSADDAHFPREGAKKDVARFLVGLMPTLPPRAVRLAGLGSFMGPELELNSTSRACSPVFDDEGTPNMCRRARFITY